MRVRIQGIFTIELSEDALDEHMGSLFRLFDAACCCGADTSPPAASHQSSGRRHARYFNMSRMPRAFPVNSRVEFREILTPRALKSLSTSRQP